MSWSTKLTVLFLAAATVLFVQLRYAQVAGILIGLALTAAAGWLQECLHLTVQVYEQIKIIRRIMQLEPIQVPEPEAVECGASFSEK